MPHACSMSLALGREVTESGCVPELLLPVLPDLQVLSRHPLRVLFLRLELLRHAAQHHGQDAIQHLQLLSHHSLRLQVKRRVATRLRGLVASVHGAVRFGGTLRGQPLGRKLVLWRDLRLRFPRGDVRPQNRCAAALCCAFRVLLALLLLHVFQQSLDLGKLLVDRADLLLGGRILRRSLGVLSSQLAQIEIPGVDELLHPLVQLGQPRCHDRCLRLALPSSTNSVGQIFQFVAHLVLPKQCAIAPCQMRPQAVDGPPGGPREDTVPELPRRDAHDGLGIGHQQRFFVRLALDPRQVLFRASCRRVQAEAPLKERHAAVRKVLLHRRDQHFVVKIAVRQPEDRSHGRPSNEQYGQVLLFVVHACRRLRQLLQLNISGARQLLAVHGDSVRLSQYGAAVQREAKDLRRPQ
mmetsp:Transcript_108/g.509  ORF Transcript_108/g.509 Transcript_108/m.509 type:complete len:409 (-) Transcript_108:40-1266(-)